MKQYDQWGYPQDSVEIAIGDYWVIDAWKYEGPNAGIGTSGSTVLPMFRESEHRRKQRQQEEYIRRTADHQCQCFYCVHERWMREMTR